jgi:hypothetical protein
VYSFFVRWERARAVDDLHDALRDRMREREGRDVEPSAAIVDSQSLRAAETAGAVNVDLNAGGDGRGGWTNLGQVTTGQTSTSDQVRWADIDGDGRADYTIVNPDGSVTTYINKGGDVGGGWFLRPKIISGTTTDQSQVNFADLDGDRRPDYLVTNGATTARLSNGGDDFADPGWTDYGQILGAV